MRMRRIAAVVGRSVATVSRFLAGPGLSSLKALNPVTPVASADQRQSRALHPELPARVGLWPRMEQQRGAHRWLPSFLAYYNARRPHSALGYQAPASRIYGNNLLQLNS
jgi:hypothetical protein